jgi:hypothetical protein
MLTVLLALLLTGTTATVKAQGGYYSATYQDFYDDLSPYGQWIDDPQYGYVWLPDAGPDFRPYYTNGYWAMTEYGNTWISNYDWGWAPFHYGRWTYDGYYGWLWIPDTEWAPAWVSWRSNDSYYGWAPMGPGISINVNLGMIPFDWWVFLSPNYFYDRSFHRYCNSDYRFRRNLYSRTNFINYTYVDNRTVYYTGPRSKDYYQHTGRRPSMFSISNNRRAGATRVNGNRINMFRPSMQRVDNAAPARPVRGDRPVSNRPQSFSGNAGQASGREMILRQRSVDSYRPAQENRMGTNLRNDQNRIPMDNGQSIQERRNLRQQEDRYRAQPQIEQQRDAQMQQQRMQDQQRAVQQQREQQTQQQRRYDMQQRDAQMQQQRMQDQQREAQQQREQQLQQQRRYEMQQREQQPRNYQMQQDAQPRREAPAAPEQRWQQGGKPRLR